LRTRTPLEISNKILELCRSICESESPIFVRHQSEPHSKNCNCFIDVERKIKESGGDARFGWEIWEWPGVLIEAVSHAIWVAPDGHLLDITPKPFELEQILFLPDPKARWNGRLVNSISMAIGPNPIIKDLIGFKDAKSRLENKGERAKKLEIVLEGEEASLCRWVHEMLGLTGQMIELGLTRNNPCLCGSGSKYKKCHGRKLRERLSRI
jgi:hypothetical protein